jgi:hypothetical protein
MGKKDPPPPGTTRIDGTDGSLAFDGEYVTVTHKWLANAGRGEAAYPIGAIAGVQVRNGMLLAAVTLVVPGVAARTEKKNPLTVNGFTKQDAANFRDLVLMARKYVDGVPVPGLEPEPADAPEPTDGPEPAVSETPAAAPGLVEQLKDLAALHSQGMLTPEEFGIAKAKLLGTSTPEDATDGW